MTHVILWFVLAVGVTSPVSLLLMWRAWLTFNLKVMEHQRPGSELANTAPIAESFLRPLAELLRGRSRHGRRHSQIDE